MILTNIFIIIPIVALARKCDPSDLSPCSHQISVPTYVCGPIIGLIGLFLCFLAHRFFHIGMLLVRSRLFHLLHASR